MHRFFFVLASLLLGMAAVHARPAATDYRLPIISPNCGAGQVGVISILCTIPGAPTVFNVSTNQYYVSNAGSDLNIGTSPSQPWQTIAKVNCGPSPGCTTPYPASSTVLFASGNTFSGCLYFKGYNNGSWGPAVGNVSKGGMTVSTYGGTGQATITSTCSGNFVAAAFLDGVANFTLNNLNIQGGTVNAPAGTYHFYYPNVPNTSGTQASTYTFGINFTPQVAGNVSGVEFYKWSGDTATSRTLGLWTAGSGGTEVASCTTSAEPASGWISCNFTSAYTTTAGTAYIASFTVTGGTPAASCTGGCTPNNPPATNILSCYNLGTNVQPGNCYNGMYYVVGPILNTTASYTAPLTNIGVEITNNCGTSCTSAFITISNNTIQNFAAVNQSSCEICIHGDSVPVAVNGPLDHISILNNTLGGIGGPTSPDINGVSGYGYGLNITNTLVQGNTISNLGGSFYPNFATGIAPGGWMTGTVQNNIIHDIGGNNGGHCGGPGGIVTFTANGITIQYNEIYHVQPVPNTFPPPSGGCDWVAYDLDGGTENSIVQYNYSHDNAGAAWLAYTVDISGIQWGNNIYRFNVSEHDDFLNTSNGIFAFGAPTEQNIKFYNNTMYSATSLFTNSSPITCIFQGFTGGAFANGSTVNNNICYNTGQYQFGGTTYIKTEDTISNITIANNVYFGGTGSVAWNYNNTGYSTLAAFQAACNCDAGSTGSTDPKLSNPGSGGTCSWFPATGTGPQPCPSAYNLQTSSTTTTTGADLLACPAGGSVATLGSTDYYGDSIAGLCAVTNTPPTGVATWGGSGTTYYIAANGADTNNGTSKSTPWAHAPGMPNCTSVCASVTPTAGNNFVFRGGDTWHWGDSSASPYIGGTWTIPTTVSGTPAGCNFESYANPLHSTCAYYGIDQTWFAGSSWARPIFNLDNPTSTASVASCSFEQHNFIAININSYVVLDNFEYVGLCVSQPTTFGAATYTKETGTYIAQLNVYAHGWTENTSGGAGTDEPAVVFGTHGANPSFNVHRYMVVDGSDTFCTGNNACEMFSFQAEGYDLDHSVIQLVSNGIASNTSIFTVHDNIFTKMYESWDGFVHSNVAEANAIFSSDIPTYFYNNIMSNTNIGVGFWPSPYAHAYWFNNVVFSNANPGNAGVTDSEVGVTTVDTKIWNNTVDSPDTWIRLTSHGTYPGTLEYENNHFIGYSPAALSSVWSGTPTNTPTDSGGELYQSEATAASQGYTPSNAYAPTATTNSTVSAGVSMASFCSGLADATAATACMHGTTVVSYNSTNHTVVLNDGAPVRQSGAWDVGAYQYSVQTGDQSPWFILSTEITGDAGTTAQTYVTDHMITGVDFHPVLTTGESTFLTNNPGFPFTYFAIPSSAGVASCYPSSTDSNFPTLLSGYNTSTRTAWDFIMPEFDQSGGCWATSRPSFSGNSDATNYTNFLNYYNTTLGLSTYLGNPSRGYPLQTASDYGFTTYWAYDMGSNLELMERNEDELAGITPGLAMLRGAATMNGNSPWGIDTSTFRFWSNGPTVYNSSGNGRLVTGWSTSTFYRNWMIAYMSGANMLHLEATDYTTGAVSGQTFNPQGLILQQFYNYAITRHPHRGKPYVPMALMQDHYSGFEPATGEYLQSQFKGYWANVYTSGDQFLSAMLQVIYPGFNNWATIPAPPLTYNTPGVPSSGINQSATFAAYQADLSSGVDPRPFEIFGNSQWGETFDIITNNCSLACMEKYKVIFLTTGVQATGTFLTNLQSYVNAGGILVANVKQFPSGANSFLGVTILTTAESSASSEIWVPTGATVTESPSYNYTNVTLGTATAVATASGNPIITKNAYGFGTVYLTTPDYFQNTFNCTANQGIQCNALLNVATNLIGLLQNQASPVSVSSSTPLEWMINTNNGGQTIIATLVNTKTDGTAWSGNVTFNAPSSNCRSTVSEWTQDTVIGSFTTCQITISATVPAYDVRVYALTSP